MRLTTLCARVLVLCALALLLTPCTGEADVAPYMSYQGVLRDAVGDPVSDGAYAVTFKIYDVATGGTELWTEGQTLSAAGGIINALLGSVVPLNTLAFDIPYWLGITVEDETELVPRTPFATVPYAAHAGFADTVLDADDDWEISGDDIAHNGGVVTITGELDVYGSVERVAEFSTDNPTSNAKAVSGIASATGVATWPVGVYGESLPLDGYGYGGYFKGTGVGVTGQVLPTGAGPSYRAVLANCNGGSGTNYGVWTRALGSGTNYGIRSEAADGIFNWAGFFYGDVHVTTTLSAGLKLFKIDHPLDPENMYLQHSCVESDEMTNVYNGNVTLDGMGEAWVEMPEWFEALNQDFRYQLTAIGAPGPNLHIAEEIRGNRFLVAGGVPGMKVSWLVSGVRHDPFAVATGMVVEKHKRADEVGKYMHPEAYGMPRTAGVAYHEEPQVPGELTSPE